MPKSNKSSNNINKKTRKSKKYIFTLCNINTEKIDQKYGITIISNIFTNEKPPDNTTKITELSDLNSNTSCNIISFLDETKRIYQCTVSIIDFTTGKDTEFLKYSCYWCRHPFDSRPIGCPIKFISNKAVKKYYSEVSKDNYTIKENITNYKKNMLDTQKSFVFIPLNNSSQINIDKKEFYSSDGIFCSFNCCKAFIKDNKHNVLYEHSEFLLSKLYFDMFGVKNIVINPAPHWRLLIEYGGNLTINQFRDNFNKTKYDFHGTVKNQDIFKPVGSLFEEKINF
jgi:hypothetical protein